MRNLGEYVDVIKGVARRAIRGELDLPQVKVNTRTRTCTHYARFNLIGRRTRPTEMIL